MGAVWQSPAGGPGRDLRSPPPRRVWDQKDHPGSYAMDRTLAGRDEQPVIQRATQTPDLPAGQLYDAPHRADIRRDLGAAQVVRKAVSKPQQPVVQNDDEVGWETNSPRQKTGFRVIRSHGSAQMVPVHADPSVSSLIGAHYFTPDGPSAAPGPVCAWCFEPLTPGPAGSEKKYCCASHRVRGNEQRKKEAQLS